MVMQNIIDVFLHLKQSHISDVSHFSRTFVFCHHRNIMLSLQHTVSLMRKLKACSHHMNGLLVNSVTSLVFGVFTEKIRFVCFFLFITFPFLKCALS